MQGPELPEWGNLHEGYSTIFQDKIYIINNPDSKTVYSIPVTMQGDWEEVKSLDIGFNSLSLREVYPAPVVSPDLLGC